ncbi:DNA polymerase IV [Enterorhabdus mucosicola]|uniref:DNA polymerase IV n=1 Tax=Adlercreutzia mucosicola TaxID=580026 RepID=A0A6N8JLQ7_9ACTN|nr:DNA polymerase IV [Adlercreutzia mucosicola]MVX59987.1 DNA polymerase IV [Adlercreutzia mucosicola]
METFDDIPLPPWEGPAILLVDLDAFFASVEQLDHPGWRGKPVIVGGDADAHGVVSTCSYEARAFGVRSAMAASLARSLCPDAIWTHGNFHRYREVSSAIMAILRDETPHVQQVSIDEAFMDVTPTAVNTEHPVAVARRIQARVAALGVTCSIGVGASKSVAKIASDVDKPRGLTVVYPGTEAAFLGNLPVRSLSGVGAAAERILHSYGVRTLGDMGTAEPALLRRVFGKNGEMMRDRALGRDRSVVAEDETVKSVSNEVTFADDLTERADIEAALSTIAAKVGRRLRRKGLAGRTVAVKVRFSDRTTHSVQRSLPAPTDDDIAFAPLLHAMIDDIWMPGARVRLLGVAVTHFDEAPVVQESLFDGSAFEGQRPEEAPLIEDETKRRELLRATDALRDRFGDDTVRFGFELRQAGNTTGSSSKNVEDYK